ncbi:MAG TPA: hypothetical protein VLB45_02450 [Nitrosopumilaceae archaeon]|nr:hypothetical protein [Nitrosopumilaceae archaeon]
MQKPVIISIILGVGIVSAIVIFQASSICYPKRVEIDFDLKELESGSMEYSSCLDLKHRIGIFNQKCDPDFNEIRC